MEYRSPIRITCALSLLLASPVILGALGPRQYIEQRLLAAHNRERDVVGVGQLRWDEQLAAAARDWAHHLASTGRLEHAPDQPGVPPQGENLWAGTRGHYQPEGMVGLWIEEKQYYKPGVFPNVTSTASVDAVGHYTQLIWSRTERVGCALAEGRYDDILVCRYRIAGNVVGQRPA